MVGTDICFKQRFITVSVKSFHEIGHPTHMHICTSIGLSKYRYNTSLYNWYICNMRSTQMAGWVLNKIKMSY